MIFADGSFTRSIAFLVSTTRRRARDHLVVDCRMVGDDRDAIHGVEHPGKRDGCQIEECFFISGKTDNADRDSRLQPGAIEGAR